MTKKKIISRIIQIIVVLIGISFFTFLLTYLAPGNPAQVMLTSSGVMPTESAVEELSERMGFNDPFLVRYFRWLTAALHGDFGDSYTMNKPVVDLLLVRLWPTVKLTLLSMIMMLLVTIPLGVLSATHKDSWIDNFVRVFTFFGVSIPNFWVGLLLMLAFCVEINVFPVICSGGDFKSIFLPALTLAIAMSS